MQRVEEADVVDALGRVGKERADLDAAFAVLLKFPRRFEQVAGGGELHAGFVEGKGLAVVTVEQRLGIERVDLRGTPRHEQKDDSFGLRREMWLTRRQGIDCLRRRSSPRFVGKQRSQRQMTEADGAALQHHSAGQAIAVDVIHERDSISTLSEFKKNRSPTDGEAIP